MAQDPRLPNDPPALPPSTPWKDPSLLAALVLLAVMISPVLAGRIYVLNDLGEFHLPLRAFYAEQLARRESFLWSPQLFCGYYVAGEGQAGMFHPWHLLLYSQLPLTLAFALEVVGSYPLMFAGTYLFLRRRLPRRAAALFGSLAFTFCSFNLMHFIHVNAVAVIAHLPWLLLALDVMMLDADRRRVVLAQLSLVLLTASQVLLGYPQYVWFSLLAEAAYLGFLAIDRRCDARRAEGASLRSTAVSWWDSLRSTHPAATTVRWGLAKATGVLVGAVQILPTLDVLQHSVRHAVSPAYTNYGSVHPLNLLQTIAPYLYITRIFGRNRYELGMYLGAVPLVLLIWLVLQRRQLGSLRRLSVAAAGMGIAAFVLASGRYGLVYGLQRWLPIVGGFRCPCRYLVLVDLAVAVLAAVGFLLLVRHQERQENTPWRRLAPLAVPIVLSMAAATLPWLFPNLFFGSPRALLLGPLLIGGAALLVALAARGARWAVTALVFFAAADLGLYGMSYTVLRETENVYRFVRDIPIPQKRPDGRLLMNPEPIGERGVHYGNAILLTGWWRADGYAGLDPARRLDYRQLAALRVAGVRWVLNNELTKDLPGLIGDDDWLRVPDPLPRARLVTRAIRSGDPARQIVGIPVETAALVESPLDLPGGVPGIATLYGDRPGRLEIHVQCDSPQLLVVAERYHPGWQARVDGRAAPVHRVNGDFLGCVVSPGQRRVELAFHPASFRNGLIVSAIGLLIAAAMAIELLGIKQVAAPSAPERAPTRPTPPAG